MKYIEGLGLVVGVASFAEAWIEKLLSCILIFLELVASFAEAWIEKINH